MNSTVGYFVARALPLLLFATSAAALVVTNPAPGTSTVLRAGDDYATSRLANPWDMADAADVPFAFSRQLANAHFSNGHFVADTTNVDPQFYVLWPGYISAVPTANGARFPIDSAHYRYFTMKIRLTDVSGNQPVLLYYMEDSSFQPGVSFGVSKAFYVTPGQWQIVHFDMTTDTQSAQSWTDFPAVRGLRIDPTNAAGVHVEVDWVHLSAPANSSSEKYLVTWNDSTSGPFSVYAVDSDGAELLLGSGITAKQFLADFSMLPPGPYTVKVTRSGASAQSAGQVIINAPPLLKPLQPDARGDQTHNFAKDLTGNAWGPMDAADVALAQLTNVSYSNPVGSLTARPTGNDPAIYFNTHGHAIAADTYRSLCFTLEVAGPQQVGAGSVARLFWGDIPNNFSTSEDIVLASGLNEYCFADLGDMPLESSHDGVPWSGQIDGIRLDPHEFPVSAACQSNPSPVNCRDIRLDSFVLSPFHSADPEYTFQWQIDDADNASSTTAIYLDPDKNPTNGNEILARQATMATGVRQLTWGAPPGLPLGLYYVLFESSDGVNVVTRYAPGPLRVTATEPDLIFADGFDH